MPSNAPPWRCRGAGTAGQQAFSGLIAGWAWRGPRETRGRAADLTGQYRFRLGREGGGVDAGGACPAVDCMVGAGQGTPAAVPPALTRHRTAQPFPNVASASGAAVGGWSPRRASAGESGRRLCKATSGWAGAFCPFAGQNHSHVLWELLAPAREPRAGDPSRAQGHLCCQVQGAAAALRLCPTCWT